MTHKLRINRLYWPVTSLGFGRRAGIWFQGCSIGCIGCGSKHTWSDKKGKHASVAQIMNWLDSLQIDVLDGITVSGGEPFEQPRGLLELLKSIRSKYGEREGFDVLVYSGYTWRKLEDRHQNILKYADTIVSGPFAYTRDSAWLRGSDNQEIHTLSPIGRQRYGDANTGDRENTLQIVVDESEVRVLGIPNRGDLERLKARLAGQGVHLVGEVD